ncbi:NAC domain-containing protein 8 [Artemisia annua]|uniref:NAC domain-containing protein 8 n=1 Tax=Artemisia annua TaxID=35608 RepID=A0A2U1NZZ3_ARTAN|nr:NAC domain-containing protein 8 [Artemisia annua]
MVRSLGAVAKTLAKTDVAPLSAPPNQCHDTGDLSGVRLSEYLVEKCGVANGKPHLYGDVHIPTLNVDKGICHKNPENLLDTSSSH